MGKITKIIIFYVIFTAVSLSYCFADETWKNLSGNLDADLYSIAVDSSDDKVIYVGSHKAVFKTADKGKNWNYLYTVKGVSHKINFILIDSENSEIQYFATDNGLFRGSDGDKTFDKIFRAGTDESKEVFCVAKANDGYIYIGTQNGVFRSMDAGISWVRLSGIPRDSRVVSINLHPALANLIYIVSDSGVYRSFDKAETWERVFVTSRKDEATYEEESILEEEETSRVIPRCLLINRSNPQFVYLGTTKGLFISSDAGKSWMRKTITDLADVEIKYIISSDDSAILYAATNHGVFKIKLDNSQAEEIYQDLPARNIRMISLDSDGKLWAVTDKGLFKTIEVPEAKESHYDNCLEEYKIYFQDEPNIQEVQNAAIMYAEVHPEKIKQWRTQSRMKAFVPEFDLDYDKTVTTALGATYDRVQVGPRDWGMALKWDLAEFIWSTDQTSIDVRSRLMVQLRSDILDEVNRLFFERCRVKLDLILNPPADLKERINKQLRLEELTAGLDALTGGYFSRRLNELSGK